MLIREIILCVSGPELNQAKVIRDDCLGLHNACCSLRHLGTFLICVKRSSRRSCCTCDARHAAYAIRPAFPLRNGTHPSFSWTSTPDSVPSATYPWWTQLILLLTCPDFLLSVLWLFYLEPILYYTPSTDLCLRVPIGKLGRLFDILSSNSSHLSVTTAIHSFIMAKFHPLNMRVPSSSVPKDYRVWTSRKAFFKQSDQDDQILGRVKNSFFTGIRIEVLC